MWSTPIFDQLLARGKMPSSHVSQWFPGLPRTPARTQASSSQTKCLTDRLHPDIEFFNCGHTCGQRRFLTDYRQDGNPCNPSCPNGFRAFQAPWLKPKPPTPKLSALPTALHPVIHFSPPRLKVIRENAKGYRSGHNCPDPFYFTGFGPKVKSGDRIFSRFECTALCPPGPRRRRTRR